MDYPVLMPRYKLAIFDFDGTLADSFPWFCSVLNETARRFGFRQVEAHEVEGLRDMTSQDIIAALGVPLWKLPMIAHHMRKLAARSADTIPLHAGAAKALECLHSGGVQLAIISSNGEDTIRRILGPAAGWIAHYDCGASIWGKSAKFQSALKSLSIPANQTISVGDEVRDIDAARKANIAAGAVTFGYNSPKVLREHKPDMIFTDFAQICAHLLD